MNLGGICILGASAFLSCLYGSERCFCAYLPFYGFLSCLYGSEPAALGRYVGIVFLSCLYGSELQYLTPT